MRTLVYSPGARRDLLDIQTCIEIDDPGAADRVQQKLLAACEGLLQFPEMGRWRDDLGQGLRSVVVKPYLIFYRVRESTVQVVRVLHGARDLPVVFEGEGG